MRLHKICLCEVFFDFMRSVVCLCWLCNCSLPFFFEAESPSFVVLLHLGKTTTCKNVGVAHTLPSLCLYVSIKRRVFRSRVWFFARFLNLQNRRRTHLGVEKSMNESWLILLAKIEKS